MRRKKAIITVDEHYWKKEFQHERPTYNILVKFGKGKPFYEWGSNSKEAIEAHINNFIKQWSWNYIFYYKGKRMNK